MTASGKVSRLPADQRYMLGIDYKSAWFMCHRIREAMSDPNPTPSGGDGKIIEADEAYRGRKETPIPSAQREGRPCLKRKLANQKRPILALVERGGEARVKHMPHVTGATVRDFLVKNADRKSRLHADESNLYPRVGTEFATQETVNYSAEEHARGDSDEQILSKVSSASSSAAWLASTSIAASSISSVIWTNLPSDTTTGASWTSRTPNARHSRLRALRTSD